MLCIVEITWLHWAGFVACLLLFLSLDIGFFHREAHVVKFREAFFWTALWTSLALLFALGLKFGRGEKEALEFVTGYLLEMSLSMDNVFVIALIFTYFRVPAQYQHRVLFWGVMGAIIMRGVMICLGVVLISWLTWILYALGAFVLYTGVRMLFHEPEVHPEKNRVVIWARKLYPVTPHLDGQRFITNWQSRRALTPLALVLLLVETTDLIFAVDSIPAIFAVTTKPFIVFTSNMFAILGLRSLYFVLVGAIGYFRFLNVGLSMVLIFIGAKMLLDPHGNEPKWFQIEIPTAISLTVVAAIILAAILVSVISAQLQKAKPQQVPPD
jgi:TerC family integral membrane protein